jgi:signal transduction histidine kinase
MNKIFTLLLCFLFTALAAINTDSIINTLHNKQGKEKAQTLIDLCYYLSVSNVDLSIKYGYEALRIAQSLNDPLFAAGCANDLALTYYYKGNYDSSIILANHAYLTRLKFDKKRDAAASLSKVALAYYEQGNYTLALEKNIEAVNLFEQSGAKLESAKIKNNIGSILERNMQLDEAKNMYLQSSEITLNAGDYEGYVSAKGNYGIILKKQDSLDKAMDIFYELYAVAQKHCRKEYLAQIYQEIGAGERRRNNTTKGLEFYLKAKEIYELIGSLNGMAIIYINIGNCYTDLRQYTLARTYLTKGLQLSIDIKSLMWQRAAYLGLYSLEKINNNFINANTYLEKYQAINDSIYSLDNQNKILTLQTKYNTKEKDNKILEQKNKLLLQQNEIIQQELKIKKANVLIIYLIFLLFLSAVIVIFIIQKNKLHKKQLEINAKTKLQKERSRISKDLHDNLGAELSIISSQLDLKAMHETELNKKNELENISDAVRKTASLMRDTIWTISSEEISATQLAYKTQEFAGKIFNHSKINLVFQNLIENDLPISPETALTVYRVFQEIIHNAYKHSQATKFSIIFKNDHNTIISEFSDNGIGFNPDNITNGYGLNNIAERLQSIDANYTIQSDKHGTIYIIKFGL